MLLPNGDVMAMDEPMPGSQFSSTLGSFDFYYDDPVTVTAVQAPADQLPKELIFIPALMFLGLIMLMQRGRINKEGEPA